VPATPVYRCWCHVPLPSEAGSGCWPPGGCHSSGSALALDRAGRAVLLRLRGAAVVDLVAARAALVTVRWAFLTERVAAFRVAYGVGIIALSMAPGRPDLARRATHLPAVGGGRGPIGPHRPP
jgi:hypothetical protein